MNEKQEPNKNRGPYIRHKTFTLIKEGDVYVLKSMDSTRKGFGSPVKSEGNKGRTYIKKDRRRKKKHNKKKNL